MCRGSGLAAETATFAVVSCPCCLPVGGSLPRTQHANETSAIRAPEKASCTYEQLQAAGCSPLPAAEGGDGTYKRFPTRQENDLTLAGPSDSGAWTIFKKQLSSNDLIFPLFSILPHSCTEHTGRLRKHCLLCCSLACNGLGGARRQRYPKKVLYSGVWVPPSDHRIRSSE